MMGHKGDIDMMKQRDAVYQALVNVVGSFEGVCAPTKEQRQQVRMILFTGFQAKEIELSKPYDDDQLMAYIPGLISNWIRKDPRLNGDVKYVAKNPGVRSGSGDATVKAMRVLLSGITDDAGKAEVQAAIDARLAEIKPAKAALTDEQKAKLVELGLGHLIG
jgi:hypothetical protein